LKARKQSGEATKEASRARTATEERLSLKLGQRDDQGGLRVRGATNWKEGDTEAGQLWRGGIAQRKAGAHQERRGGRS